jgi:hypothetical protein
VITAPWLIIPPTSVTSPAMTTKTDVQQGSAYAVTRMSSCYSAPPRRCR